MPTTRSSISKATLVADASTTSKATSVADASTGFDLYDELSVNSTPVDFYDLQTLMLSIQANQKTIEAINSRLNEHSCSLEATSKTLTDLDNTVQAVSTTITEIPKTFEIKLETIDTTECFKTYPPPWLIFLLMSSI